MRAVPWSCHLTPARTFLIIMAVLASCAPTYDAKIDNQLSTVQSETDQGIVKLIETGKRIQELQKARDPQLGGTLAEICSATNLAMFKSNGAKKAITDDCSTASYDSNLQTFYGKVSSDLNSLEMRMTASPDLSATPLSESFKKLQDNIDELEGLHSRQGYVGPPPWCRSGTP
jgi:hypothetical protein